MVKQEKDQEDELISEGGKSHVIHYRFWPALALRAAFLEHEIKEHAL
jgi:hypothetical protein